MPALPTNPFELERLVAQILDDAAYITMSPGQRLAAKLPSTTDEMRDFIRLHRKDYTDGNE